MIRMKWGTLPCDRPVHEDLLSVQGIFIFISQSLCSFQKASPIISMMRDQYADMFDIVSLVQKTSLMDLYAT